jgi:hypothetical protein
VDRVRPITSDAKTLRHFGCDWLILPVPGEENTSTGVEVWPLAGFLFQVDVGEDCEPLQLGLCQYPVKVLFQGKELRTKKRAGWRLTSFSKSNTPVCTAGNIFSAAIAPWWSCWPPAGRRNYA